MTTISRTQHEANVRALPCVVTGGVATLHHAQGPSVNARLAEMGLPHKGYGQRGNGDALLLPLCADLHFAGPHGIDVGGITRKAWEELYGLQSEMLDRVGGILGYNLWTLHILWMPDTKIVPRRR